MSTLGISLVRTTIAPVRINAHDTSVTASNAGITFDESGVHITGFKLITD